MLISCCCFSCFGNLLSLLLAGDLFLPKISLRLGTTLTRAPSLGKWPLMLTCPPCSYKLSSNTDFNHLCGTVDRFAFVLACSCLQHLLYHDAIHLMKFVFEELHQDCPFLLCDSCLLPIKAFQGVGRTRATLSLKALLQAVPFDISAVALSLLVKFLMPSIMPYVASAPLLLLSLPKGQL